MVGLVVGDDQRIQAPYPGPLEQGDDRTVRRARVDEDRVLAVLDQRGVALPDGQKGDAQPAGRRALPPPGSSASATTPARVATDSAGGSLAAAAPRARGDRTAAHAAAIRAA